MFDRLRRWFGLPPKAATRSYAAAAFNRLNSDWISSGAQSADEAMRYGLRVMRDRAREMARNNPHAVRYPRLVSSNSHTIRHALTGDNVTTGVREPASGLTVTAFIAESPVAATPIHADLQIALDEVGSSGDYLGVIPGAAITERLTGYLGQRVWEVVTDGQTARFVTELRVRATRQSD